jgi:general secretion pathway protein D
LSTSKSLSVFVVMTLGLAGPSAAPAVAGNVAVRFALAADLLGQTAKSKTGNERRDVEALLIRARQAMKDGDFAAADTLIAKAEKLNVEFSVLHLGDTPKKARADYLAQKRNGKKGRVERPSQKFSPETTQEATADRDVSRASDVARTPAPARVPIEVGDPEEDMPLTLPDSGGRLQQSPISQRVITGPADEGGPVTRLQVPGGEAAGPPETSPQIRQQSDTQLLAARRALAEGDARRAQAAVDTAKKLNFAYGYHDDTPAKVEAAIRTYRKITETTGNRQDEAARRLLAGMLMDQAAQLLRWKDYDEAERLVQHVKGLRINYGPFEAKPDTLMERITAARRQKDAPADQQAEVVPATTRDDSAPAVLAAEGANRSTPLPATRAVYDGNRDTTLARTATALQETLPDEAEKGPVPPIVGGAAQPGVTLPLEPAPEPIEAPRAIPSQRRGAHGEASQGDNAGMQLFRAGQEALKNRDSKTALQNFKQAYAVRDQLDAATAQKVQDYLQMLSAPAPATGSKAKTETLSDSAVAKQQLQVKQLSADIAQKEIAAGKAREKDPKRAMDLLKEARKLVEDSTIASEPRAVLLRRVDRKVAELDKYVLDNRAQIELDDSNKTILKEVERRLLSKVETDDKLARIVEEYNQLMDQERWAEAEVLAKRARELDPENAVVKQLIWQQRLASRTRRNQHLIDDKESAAWEALDSVEQAAIPFDDHNPIQFTDAKKWKDLTDRRAKQMADKKSRRTEREIDIERKLKTPVSLKFRNRPLQEVIDQLGKLTAVNLHLDPKGLEEEGITSDTPVTIDLTQDISLRSALNLILEPMHLSYVIKDEVLKITSEQLRDGEVYTVTYNVADLVTPIPNFLPNGRTGLAAAIMDGYNMTGAAGGMGGMAAAPATALVAGRDGASGTALMNPALLAQMNQLMPGGMGTRSGFGQSGPLGGPGSMGHGVQPDFDPLIDLITSTIKPQTWDEVGGPGTVSKFSNNLSLVISQTEEVHQAIADLLEQLRRNQDLQVTIEVRFITLNDNFFERIGVDFQFNIKNLSAGTLPQTPTQGNLSEVVGLNTVAGNAPSGDAPNYTANLDIPFRQSSFNLAVPQFGQPVEVAHFGFAILSDIEAYFLVNAAQGDRRSNVLQAPKVTLFNGQTASVVDQTSTPFVVSVVPVVGDFAAAYQPVITVLSEGTALSVQATISNDRRFVRLTVLPSFTTIGDVTTFTFSGSTTTNNSGSSSTSTGGAGGDSTAATGNATTTSNGITIQLPSFAIVSVQTTVSVPDGGTVLLGGIKRLSEGRNEFGVPILSKLPYINRLFKNVGIGRETQSLMMMVTPRIIIQEEEEERLGIQTPP